jgi:ATP:ADP antiporter, AAA family
VFWALMADRFSLEQSKRIFGIIAVGGTLGAIFGPWLAGQLVAPLGTAAMLLVSAAFLVFAIVAARLVARLQPEVAKASVDHAVIGGNAWAGISAVFRSPYLLGISSYVLLMTVIGTFLYFTRLAMVAAAADDTDARTAIFANIDLLTQIVTLVLQMVVTGHIMKRFGVSVALILLPIVVSLGFVGLAMAASFAVLILFEASFRAVQRAITRPARETLFTVVTREEKYKSKAFTDTFVYRGGDVVGAWTEGGLRAIGLGLVGLASVAIPLAVLWAGLGLWLGRQQTRITQSRASTAGRIEPGMAHPAPQSEPAG